MADGEVVVTLKPKSQRRVNRGTYTIAELGRDMEEMRQDHKALTESFNRLEKRLTLYVGLLVGAMAASGLIEKGAAELLKTLFGLPL